MDKLAVFSIVALLLIPIGYNAAFARTWDVTIPTGAGDSTNAEKRFFYSPWELTVDIYDEVQWGNGDTVAHTVTSGNATAGPDGTFDSGMISPGKSFTFKFVKGGTFPYYCSIHPWMAGSVMVAGVESMKVLHNVGADAGYGKTVFDVEYLLEKTLLSASVDEKEKSVTFKMGGKGNDGDLFVAKIPKNLVSGSLLVWVDGQMITNFEKTDAGGINTLTIPLSAKSETVTVVGTTVVPEFGPIAVLILAIAVITIIATSLKSPGLYRIQKS